MDKWLVLGIEKTKDKDAIKKAYREKLVKVNPEDNQEGFMALRNAYEEAVYEADMVDEEVSEDTLNPGTLEYELDCIYKDFNRRIDISEWENILEREEFISIDTSDEAMNRLFVFLMDNHLIPQKIYQLLVERFDINVIKDELCQKYPKGFIDHILDNAKYRDPINYYLFDGNLEKVDEFIHYYYGLDNACGRQNVEEEKRLIEELELIDVYHPYLEICKLRHEIHKINKTVSSEQERLEKYGNELKEIHISGETVLADYPDDFDILLFCGDMAIMTKDMDSAQKHYTRLSELKPDDFNIKIRLGNLYSGKGEFEAARDLFMDLIDINPYDDGARYGLIKANQGLIEKYNKILEEDPDNERVKYDLVWCYYRNGLPDKCIEVLTGFEPTMENKCEYYDLLGRNYMGMREYEKALEGLFAWRDAILEIPKDDNSEKAVHNRSRFYYANFYIGECYVNLKKYDEARKHLEIATMKNHEYIEYAYAALCRLEYDTGCYEDCIKVCEKLIDSSLTFDAYHYMSECYYKLDDYSNTIKYCEMAIRCARNFYQPYVRLVKLYWEWEEYDRAEIVIERFEQLGYPNDDIDLIKARLSMRRSENEKAIELFQAILDRKGTEDALIEDEEDYLNVYTLIASCYERLDMEEKALTYLEEGLKAVPDDEFFLNRIANVCHVLGDFDRSIECADRILQICEDDAYRRRAYDAKIAALACLKRFDEAKSVCELNAKDYGLSRWFAVDYAELLVRMNDLEGAIKVMEKAIEETDDNDLIKPLIGNLCCFYGNEGYLDKAYEVFLEGKKRNPEDYQLFRSMGFIYLDHGRYQEAVELLTKAVEFDTDKRAYTCGLLLQALSKLDDINKPEYKKYFEIAEEQFENVNRGYVHIKHSEFLWATGRFEEAIEACNMALMEKREKDSYFIDHYDAWHELAVVYFNMGDYAKSKECYEKAQEIFGHNQLYIDGIAQCEEKLKEGK